MDDVDRRNGAKRIAQARGLGGVTNDTKWGEFLGEVIAQNIPVEVKILYEELPFECRCIWCPSTNYIEGTGMGPELFVFIEFVRSSKAMTVQSIAAAVGLECEVHEGLATVYGYR
jgi:hypothetical protein